MRTKHLIAALFPAVLAGMAGAEGYSVSDLGNVSTRELCMLKAEVALQRYMSEHGADSVSKSTWSIYGWDMRPGDQDVVIICPQDSAGKYLALLIVHGEATEDQRIFTKDALKNYWE